MTEFLGILIGVMTVARVIRYVLIGALCVLSFIGGALLYEIPGVSDVFSVLSRLGG